jgi:hypothetical protein
VSLLASPVIVLSGAAAVLALIAVNATTQNNPVIQGRDFMPFGLMDVDMFRLSYCISTKKVRGCLRPLLRRIAVF